jgi:hypothetical protein
MVLSSAGKRLAALLPKRPAQNTSNIPTPIKSARLDQLLFIPFLLMFNIKIKTNVGTELIRFFLGEGDHQIQFNEEEMNAL